MIFGGESGWFASPGCQHHIHRDQAVGHQQQLLHGQCVYVQMPPCSPPPQPPQPPQHHSPPPTLRKLAVCTSGQNVNSAASVGTKSRRIFLVKSLQLPLRSMNALPQAKKAATYMGPIVMVSSVTLAAMKRAVLGLKKCAHHLSRPWYLRACGAGVWGAGVQRVRGRGACEPCTRPAGLPLGGGGSCCNPSQIISPSKEPQPARAQEGPDPPRTRSGPQAPQTPRQTAR